MATFDYADKGNIALKLIQKFGESAVLVRNEGSAIDPNEPEEGGEFDPIEYTTTAVLIPLSMQERSLYPQFEAVSDIRKILMEAVNITTDPQIGDTVQYNGSEWQVKNVKQLRPASTNVLWTLIVGR